ncbi:winged helix-turn-helix domain-containing protein [Enterococcus hulanensis]|uniref:winged helix-turn-helix domain-containing protein n=1 Tax=Enterococcus hulanensis TaxID=2559929 RepID=UPI002890905F|nr:winged helix-turn-helix domain-containing protein [Enterococcus hulanensis]MDT2659267.1 winged helix-turn-helix domain-containing protein [Enterococcus hulanensis]
MCTIMIITRNILVEQNLQKQLQHLGHEVFCKSIETSQSEFRLLVKIFDSIILSETLSNEESQIIIQQVHLEKEIIEVIRKVEIFPSKKQAIELTELGINSYLPISATLEDLREKYAEKQTNREKDTSGLFNLVSKRSCLSIPLSKNEKKLLRILLENTGSCIERNIISEKIWGIQSTNSSMCQLSALIKKIQKKFEEAGFEHRVILTYWGQGYQLNPQAEDSVQGLLSNKRKQGGRASETNFDINQEYFSRSSISKRTATAKL